MDKLKKYIIVHKVKTCHGTAKQPVLKSETTLPAIHLQVSMYLMIIKQLYRHKVKVKSLYMYHS